MWEVEECQLHKLRNRLNDIDAAGGTVFQIIDGSGTRKDNVLIVWVRHSDKSTPSKK